MAIGKLLLKLGIDTTNLDKELGKVEKSMTKFGNTMKNVGSDLTQSLTLPIVGLGAASLKAFADMERLEGGLTAIMGSSKDAAIEMEKLRKVAENPGLALPQVVKASASLQSVGMDADKARNVIEQFGNAVARAQGGPEEFAGVIYGLTQISSSTSILAEDLNIVNGGLNNSFDNLKDNINASLAELGKTINESLKLEIVFDKVSKKIQELVDKFKLLTPEQQENIVKIGLIAAAVGPLIFILGQFATSISSIITLSRTLIATFTVLSGGTYLLVAAIGALVAYYATTDEGQKSLSKTGALLSESFDRIKAAFQTTLNLLSKLQPLFDLLLFVFGKIAVFTFEVVLSQINAVLSTINFLYDGVIKVLEGLRLINKQKVQPNMGVADRPSGAGGSWGDETKTPSKTPPKGPPVIPKGTPSNIQAKSSPGLDAIRELQTNKSFMEFNTVSVNALPTLDLIPQKLESISAANEKLKQTNLDLANSFTAITHVVKSVEVALTPMQSILVAATDAFSVMAMQGETDMKKLGSAAIQAARMVISSYIKEGVAGIVRGILSGPLSKTLGPGALAVAGAAGAGAAVLFNTLLNKVAPPKLAQGGLAYAPTMAMVGDNRNARVDPEVIAPLSKLKGMLDGGGSPYILTTRVAGSDLLVIMEKAKNINTRIR